MRDKTIFLKQVDVASMWGVSEKTVAVWRKQGKEKDGKKHKLKYYRMGSRVRFKPADIEAYEIEHCLVRTANTSASNNAKAAELTHSADGFFYKVTGWTQFPLALLKLLQVHCAFEIGSLEGAIKWLEADEAKSRAARVTSKAVKAAIAKSSYKSNDNLIQIFTKLVNTPNCALPGRIPVRDVRWVIERMETMAKGLKRLIQEAV